MQQKFRSYNAEGLQLMLFNMYCIVKCHEVQTAVFHMSMFFLCLFQPGQHRYLLVHPALWVGLRQGAHVPGKMLVCNNHPHSDTQPVNSVMVGWEEKVSYSEGRSDSSDITHEATLPCHLVMWSLNVCFDLSEFYLWHENGNYESLEEKTIGLRTHSHLYVTLWLYDFNADMSGRKHAAMRDLKISGGSWMSWQSKIFVISLVGAKGALRSWWRLIGKHDAMW